MKMEDRVNTKGGEIEKTKLLHLASEKEENANRGTLLGTQVINVEHCLKVDSLVYASDSQTDNLPSSDCPESSTPATTLQNVAQRSSNNVSNTMMIEYDSALDVLEGISSNENSCVNSPLFDKANNEFGSRSLSPFNVDFVVKEYDKLKDNYESLQNEYRASLEREKDLCERLKEYGGRDDESFNTITNINTELRKELDFVVGELQKLQNDNRKLQEENNGNKGKEVTSNPDQLEKIEDIIKLEQVVSELEAECKQFQEERDNAKEKLSAHDMAAKRAITALQKEMATRIEQVGNQNEALIKEKDALVLKLAKQEESITKHEKKIDVLEKKLMENKKEIDRWKMTSRQKDSDHAKVQNILQEKDDEHIKLKSEMEKAQEESSSQVVKVKWAQNKLKQELEAHKDTKTKLALANSKIDEMKEEGEQIRLACQEMIKKYQNSEEMRSVQLDKALKEVESSMKVKEHEIAVQCEIDRKKSQELEAIKTEHRKALGEISSLKTTVSMLEGKLSNYSIKSGEMEKRISTLSKKEEELVLTDKMLNDVNQDLKGYKEQVLYYIQLEEELRKQLLDVESEARECKQREAELLLYTEKLTENNARWKSQACDLQSRVDIAEAQITDLHQTIEKSNLASKSQGASARKEKEEFQNTLEEYAFQLEQKQKLVEELTLHVEEAQDEIKVLKRKSASTIKDLQRQLHQSKKRVDQLEDCLSNTQDGTPLKSRASSNSSLDRLSNDSGTQVSVNANSNGTHITNPTFNSSNYRSYDGEYSVVQPSKQRNQLGEIEVDKGVLVDRICRLQKAHAKKNEKLEFLEEHNKSLLEDIKKKNKVLQYYVLREESGMLISNKFDRNKVEMSRKGGIMASIYSSRVSDKDMTLDLSLEINRKLQAVVEDTLLKNITLKESVNTLGAEIARLQDDLQRTKK